MIEKLLGDYALIAPVESDTYRVLTLALYIALPFAGGSLIGTGYVKLRAHRGRGGPPGPQAEL